MHYSQKHTQDGFTFIEIVVVLLILGLLAGIGAPLAYRWLAKGQVNTTITNLKQVKSQVDFFQMEQGKYPTKLEELTHPPKGKPYFDDVPQDGWGNDFIYKVTQGKKHPYELYSEGDPSDSEAERLDVWTLSKKK